MPLAPSDVTQAILGADPFLQGSTWIELVSAIGSAVVIWIANPVNVSVQGVTTGAAGTGVVLGNLVVVPQPLPVSIAFLASGLLGVQAPLMSRAIGMGAAMAITAKGAYRGVSAGVGSGTDVSKVVTADGISLASIFTTTAYGRQLQGVQIPDLAHAIGIGVANLLLTGTGMGIVTGPAGPAPAAGTSLSSVF